jgi:hypothetical protein
MKEERKLNNTRRQTRPLQELSAMFAWKNVVEKLHCSSKDLLRLTSQCQLHRYVYSCGQDTFVHLSGGIYVVMVSVAA